MIKKKSKCLLSLLLSFTMLVTLVATPVYAADGTEASATGETTGASVKTQDVNEKEELEPDYGIAVIDDNVTSSAAAQVGDTSYTSLSAAISAANAGDTVTLLANVSESSVTVSKNLTIDLGGYTLTTSYVYVGTSGVEVTVKNGTITGTYGAYVTAGTLIFDTCTLSITDAAYAYGGELRLVSTTLTSTTTNRAVNCYDSSTVTIGAGSTVNCASGTGVVIWGDGSGESAKTPTLNVYGKINAIVCISGNGTDYSGTKINIYSSAVLTASQLGMYLPQPCTVNITGATVTGVYGAIGMKSGTLTISGNALIQGTGSYDSELTSISNGINTDGSAIIIDSYSGYAGDVTVTIQADESGNTPTIISTNAVAVREISNSASTNVVSISISAGTVTSGDGLDAISVTAAAEDYVSVTGGTYNTDVSAYTTDTTAAVANSDGTYSVVETVTGAVALVYDADRNYVGSYDSLSGAYSATPTGGTLMLIGEISAPDSGNTLSVYKTMTLDLNGNTLNGGSGIAVFVSASDITVTITDSSSDGSGTITGSGGSGLVRVMSGAVVIEGGTFTSTGNVFKTSGSDASITVNDGTFTSSGSNTVSNAGGTVTINGGTYTAATDTPVIGLASGATSVSITGGTFENSISYNYEGVGTSATDYAGIIKISGGKFKTSTTWLIVSYLADGYAVVADETEGYYTVSIQSAVLSYTSGDSTVTNGYSSVQAAINAIADLSSASNITVTMYADYSARVYVTSGEFTLDLNGYTITSDTDDGIALLVSGGTVIVTDSSEDQSGTVTMTSGNSNGSALVRVTDGAVTLTGGCYKPDSSQGTVGVSEGATLTITDGYFTKDPSDYVADNYVSAGISDDTYKYTVLSVVLGSSDNTATTAVSATSISGYGTNTLYVGVSASDIISNYSTEKYPTTSLTYTSDSSVDSGSYIFAGWYTLDGETYTACSSDMWSSTSENAYYAKFVDANALSVQCMFTYNVSGYGNIWRFFTSINGQDMDGVIFKITNTDGTEITTTTKATHAYTKYTISGTSPSTVFTPDLFSSASTYILTSYYTDSNQELGTCKVKACWITLDGTTVEGASYQFTHSSVTGKLESAE